MAVWPALAGCTEGPAGVGGWGFAGLALLLASGTAYALGALRARKAGEQALRQARTELHRHAQLRETWAWQTDSEHHLLAWQAPGQASTPNCALFDGAPAALAERLRGQLAFSELRLDTETGQEGAHCWALRGVPVHDDLGRFTGFVGSARPLDQDEALVERAAALAPLLNHPAAALVALQGRDGRWQVAHCNAAAKSLWPPLAEADLLDDVIARLPPAVAAAARAISAGAGAPGAAAGWQIEAFGPLAGGRRGLVLVQRAAATGDTAQTGESDNFSFTVSHDLRAPIRVVEGFTRIVKEDYGRLLDRVGNDHLDRVLGAAARMNLMIDALLTLARLSSQPLAHQPVNLSQLAAFIVDDLRRTAPEREAEFEIEPDLSAQGDPTLLRLVLENLLSNAWKYSARCSRAQISLRSVPHGEGGGRAFVVRDNGAGFDMRSAERLFGLFQRLHSASDFAGHGVGLASVRRIVNRHGGAVWAEAEPGRGAAFFFTLAG